MAVRSRPVPQIYTFMYTKKVKVVIYFDTTYERAEYIYVDEGTSKEDITKMINEKFEDWFCWDSFPGL